MEAPSAAYVSDDDDHDNASVESEMVITEAEQQTSLLYFFSLSQEIVRYVSVGALLYSAWIIYTCPCRVVPSCHATQLLKIGGGVLALFTTNFFLSAIAHNAL